MAFVCPRCEAPQLVLEGSLELGPDSRSDEIALQAARCHGCALTAVAVYEESRRGAGESWNHDGWQVPVVEFATLRKEIASCPRPRDKHCQCEAHERYRLLRDGQWCGLEAFEIELSARFGLKRVV